MAATGNDTAATASDTSAIGSDTAATGSDTVAATGSDTAATGSNAADPVSKVKSDDDLSQEHDMSYFRELLVSETKRLTAESDKWNEIISLTDNLSEEGGSHSPLPTCLQLMFCFTFGERTKLYVQDLITYNFTTTNLQANIYFNYFS